MMFRHSMEGKPSMEHCLSVGKYIPIGQAIDKIALTAKGIQILDGDENGFAFRTTGDAGSCVGGYDHVGQIPKRRVSGQGPVSYTHLTLPTIA